MSHFSREQFLTAVKRILSAAPKRDIFAELESAYTEPGRFYHNNRHIADCLRLLDEHRETAQRPEEIAVALWFHDAVYDTRRNDNEAESAAWAKAFLDEEGADPEASNRIHDLILATKHTAVPRDPDQKLIVDIDLAILGQPPDIFAAYNDAIRQEYAWVPWERYAPARIAVLTGFLDRTHIYTTPELATRYESPARTNLANAITQLRINTNE
ncbi:MAG: hypothetical protein OHK0029_39870 [Armatimonadaceae bacterium]